MYGQHELVKERQRQLHEMARAQSQARAHCEAIRLRAELALQLDS
jgi:pyruvate-formate lyase